MYKFVDTIKAQSEKMLPSEALQVNGMWLEEVVPEYRTLTVAGRELLSAEVEDTDIGGENGTYYLKKRYPPRTITVTYQLAADSNVEFRQAFNKLNSLLNVEQARLIFNDEPDKYFIGTKASASDIPPGKNKVTGEFEFYCTDPFKYSMDTKSFSNNGVSKSIIIENKGTMDAFVSIECVMKSESGGLAFATRDYMFQVGDFGEPDAVSIPHSDGALWSPMTESILNYWKSENVFLGNTGALQMGFMRSNGNEPFKSNTVVTDYGESGGERVYHGPARIAKLSQSGKNVSTTWCVKMYCPDSNVYTGLFQMCLVADDDTVVAYAIFAITSPQTQMGECQIFVNGVKRWAFGMPFVRQNGYTGETAPYILFNKEEDTVTFVVGGNTLKFKETIIADKIIDRISFQCAKWMGNAACVNEVYVVAAYKNYVEFKDIPNFMKEYDQVIINSREYEAKLNGNPLRIAQGSRPLTVPPGRTELEVTVSSFAKIPEFTATIREVFI